MSFTFTAPRLVRLPVCLITHLLYYQPLPKHAYALEDSSFKTSHSLAVSACGATSPRRRQRIDKKGPLLSPSATRGTAGYFLQQTITCLQQSFPLGCNIDRVYETSWYVLLATPCQPVTLAVLVDIANSGLLERLNHCVSYSRLMVTAANRNLKVFSSRKSFLLCSFLLPKNCERD